MYTFKSQIHNICTCTFLKVFCVVIEAVALPAKQQFIVSKLHNVAMSGSQSNQVIGSVSFETLL
jgi:hypothetical protein